MSPERPPMTRRRREQMRRLHATLESLAPDLAVELARVEDVLALARPVREAIVDVLVNEFTARGLRPDSEPNSYGLELESLIDVCGLAHDDE